MNGVDLANNLHRCENEVRFSPRRRVVSWGSFAGQAFVAAAVALVVSLAHTRHLEPTAQAEPRRITPQNPDQHFKSGGRLSETVLQEILVVLKRMDERLGKIEEAADRIADNSRGPLVSPTNNFPGDAGSVPSIQVRRGR